MHSGTNITAGVTVANSKLSNNVTNTSVILMTDGEDNSSKKADTQTQVREIRNKGANLYTIAFTDNATGLEDWVGSNNITGKYTVATAGDLSSAFGDIGSNLDPVPVVVVTSNSDGIVDLSSYKNIADDVTVTIYTGDEKTTSSIIKEYSGNQFKQLIPSFDLKAFMNDNADKIPEGASINIEILTKK